MNSREERFVIRIHDCCPNGRIKVNALMQYLQEAAACHAEELGVGFDDLDRWGCLWVLVNLRLEMVCAPKWGDQIVVTTWPSGCTRVVASREFIGCSAEGREFFRAATDWMILDKQTARPRNLAKLDLNLPPSGPKALATAPVRLQPLEGYARVCTLRVPFSALDFNGHVNNTEYVRWAFDAVHQRFRRLPEIRSVQLTYLAEVFEGDEVELLATADTADGLGVCIRKPDCAGGANVFLLESTNASGPASSGRRPRIQLP